MTSLRRSGGFVWPTMTTSYARLRTPLAALAISLLGCILCVPTNVRAQPSVVILGDSLSSGYGMPAEQSWVALLARRMGEQGVTLQVVNASITGETSSGGAARVENLLATYTPVLLVVELGGNDGLRGIALADTSANLRKIIMAANLRSIPVLLLGMRLPPNYGPEYTDMFYQIYQDLGAELASGLVPFFLEGVGDDATLMQADGIHPTGGAQPRLLDNVWGQLRALLPPKQP